MNSKSPPRFSGYSPTSSGSSTGMRSNKAEDTSPEITLRKALWKQGLKYRLHCRSLPGKPDIVFRRYRTVIFVDGDFWHGKEWAKRKRLLEQGSNAGYWVSKIQYNIDRDRLIDMKLRDLGWRVIRIWESDIKNDIESEVHRIIEQMDIQ